MSAIDNAMAHYQALGRQRMEVPEWAGEDGKPLVITWTPMTVRQQSKLVRTGSEGDPAKAVDIIVMKAQDENGKALFTVDDREKLLNHVDRAIVMRIAAEIARAPTLEEAEKN